MGEETEPTNQIVKELQVLQNEMQRVVLGYRLDYHISRNALFDGTGMMSVNHMSCYHCLTEMYNIMNFNSSEYLKNELLTTTFTGNAITRAKTSGHLKIPSNMGRKNGFLYYGPKLWNRLPLDLRMKTP